MSGLKRVITFPFRSKKRTVFTIVMLIFLVAQYLLFTKGVVKPFYFTLSVKPSALVLMKNEEVKIRLGGVFPFYAKYDAEFVSSNEAVIRVSDGNIVGVSQGSAVLTVSAGGKTATADVTVTSTGIIHFDKGKYIGELSGSKRSGYGTMYYQNGDIYEGYWKDDAINGFGSMTWTSKNRYVGGWKNEQFDGFGTMEYKGQYVYTGGFTNGGFDGYGIISWKHGDTYTGGFADGNLSGYGVFKWKSGDQYSGMWKTGSRDGYGEFTFNRNRSRYAGDWVNNLREGYGIEYTGDRIYYSGQWKNNLYDGFGRLYKNADTVEFEGEFKENNPVYH